jgi:hypothetical protein
MKRIKWVVLAFALTSCSTVSQTADTTHVYKRQLKFTVNNVPCNGTCVVKIAPQYKIHVEADRIDYFALETCHRRYTLEDQGDSLDYTYIPQPIEAGCPIELITLDRKNAKNGFGLMDIESMDYLHSAKLTCDGVLTTVNGSSICQSKMGLNQQIEFNEPMLVHPPEDCPMDKSPDGKVFLFKLNRGLCTYVFGSKWGFHKLVTIGTQDIVLEKL